MTMAAMPSASASEIRSRVEADFRQRLTAFYWSLQLTPPYHSVEKAGLALRDALADLQEPTLQATAADPVLLGRLFTKVIRESGLANKHRGIIAGLLAQYPDLLPPECRPLADAFRQ